MDYFLYYVYPVNHMQDQGLSNYPWELQHMPIWCGPLEMVNEALEKEGYVAVRSCIW